jgi:hypothetical protein
MIQLKINLACVGLEIDVIKANELLHGLVAYFGDEATIVLDATKYNLRVKDALVQQKIWSHTHDTAWVALVNYADELASVLGCADAVVLTNDARFYDWALFPGMGEAQRVFNTACDTHNTLNNFGGFCFQAAVYQLVHRTALFNSITPELQQIILRAVQRRVINTTTCARIPRDVSVEYNKFIAQSADTDQLEQPLYSNGASTFNFLLAICSASPALRATTYPICKFQEHYWSDCRCFKGDDARADASVLEDPDVLALDVANLMLWLAETSPLQHRPERWNIAFDFPWIDAPSGQFVSNEIDNERFGEIQQLVRDDTSTQLKYLPTVINREEYLVVGGIILCTSHAVSFSRCNGDFILRNWGNAMLMSEITDAKQFLLGTNAGQINGFILLRERNTQFGKLLTAVKQNDVVNLQAGFYGSKLEEERTNDQKTLLHIAVENNAIEVAAILLRLHPRLVHLTAKDGTTPLSSATQLGFVEMVKLLITNGANVQGVINKRTPLYIATMNANEAIMQSLIEANANVNQASDGETPLDIANKSGNAAAIKLLVDAHAEVDWIATLPTLFDHQVTLL